MKSLVIGGSSVDTLIHVSEINSIEDDMSLFADHVSINIGGTGAGKALALDVLGSEVTFITDLGDDKYKETILDFFNETSVQVIPVVTDKCTAHTNIMHSKGKRISVFTSMGTVIPKVVSHFNEMLQETDVVFLNINQFCRAYIPFLQDCDKPIAVDIHDYQEGNEYHQDFIDIADILIGSGVYIKNQKEFLNKYKRAGKDIVILTNGSNGLIAQDSTTVYQLKGFTDFTYVDSNGAGDSFVSGFMMKYLESKNTKEALHFGTMCGAMACTSYDLYNKKYTKDIIEQLVKEVSL